MMTNNFLTYSIKITGEIFISILFFPFWWYSKGLFGMLLGQKRFLANQLKSWGLMVWLKNLFKPMYSVTDWQGRLISFFMRLIQIIVRAIIMLIILIMSLAYIIFWLGLPVVIVYEILFQLRLT